jgi:hypothetical protein
VAPSPTIARTVRHPDAGSRAGSPRRAPRRMTDRATHFPPQNGRIRIQAEPLLGPSPANGSVYRRPAPAITPPAPGAATATSRASPSTARSRARPPWGRPPRRSTSPRRGSRPFASAPPVTRRSQRLGATTSGAHRRQHELGSCPKARSRSGPPRAASPSSRARPPPGGTPARSPPSLRKGAARLDPSRPHRP